MADQKQEEKTSTPDLDTLLQKENKTAEDWLQIYHGERSRGNYDKAARAFEFYNIMRPQSSPHNSESTSTQETTNRQRSYTS